MVRITLQYRHVAPSQRKVSFMVFFSRHGLDGDFLDRLIWEVGSALKFLWHLVRFCDSRARTKLLALSCSSSPWIYELRSCCATQAGHEPDSVPASERWGHRCAQHSFALFRPPVSDVISSASSKLISYLLSVFSVLLPNLRSSFGEFSKHCVK